MNPQLKLSKKKNKKKYFDTALSLVYCIPLLYFRYCISDIVHSMFSLKLDIYTNDIPSEMYLKVLLYG